MRGVLEQKPRHQGGKDQPPLIDKATQRHAYESEGRCVRFQYALDIPLFIKFLQTGWNALWLASEATNAFVGLLLDPLVDLMGGMKGDPIYCGWRHVFLVAGTQRE